mgnify:CR=1 FL=1
MEYKYHGLNVNLLIIFLQRSLISFIKKLKVKLMSSKVDNYDNMISYFKVVDKDAKKQLKNN